jgi:hypothetical protein
MPISLSYTTPIGNYCCILRPALESLWNCETLQVHEEGYVGLCHELTVVINLVLAMVNDPRKVRSNSKQRR